MNDITALAQRMKAAAENATPGRWEYYPGNTSIEYNVDSMVEDQASVLRVDSGDFTNYQTNRNGEFIALANPANVLALVEALEKAQQKVDVYDMLREDYGLCEKGVGLADFVDWQAKRIAELESRTVTVKLPDYRATYTEPFALEVEHHVRKALKDVADAAGIQVIEGGAPQGA